MTRHTDRHLIRHDVSISISTLDALLTQLQTVSVQFANPELVSVHCSSYDTIELSGNRFETDEEQQKRLRRAARARQRREANRPLLEAKRRNAALRKEQQERALLTRLKAKYEVS